MQAILSLERRPVRRLVHATHPADEVDAPCLRIALRVEAERLERNLHFDRPARVLLRRSDGMNAVPRLNDTARVIERLFVAYRPLRVHNEQERIASIVKGVQRHSEDVAVGRHEVAFQPHRDRLLRRGIVVDRGDVQIVVIVQHADFGAECCRESGFRQLLDEVGEYRCQSPRRFIESAVHHNRSDGACREHHRTGDRLGIDR